LPQSQTNHFHAATSQQFSRLEFNSAVVVADREATSVTITMYGIQDSPQVQIAELTLQLSDFLTSKENGCDIQA
jgi:hypothetical protein